MDVVRNKVESKKDPDHILIFHCKGIVHKRPLSSKESTEGVCLCLFARRRSALLTIIYVVLFIFVYFLWHGFLNVVKY